MPTLRALLLLTAALLFLCACASRPDAPAGDSGVTQFGIPFPNERHAAALSETTLIGSDAWQRSSGASELGDSMYLLPAEDGMEWAIYRFTPPLDHTPKWEQVDFAAGSIDEAWIGVADFATLRWEFSGPYSASQGAPLDGLAYLSPGGNIYVAVVASSGHFARIDAVSVATDDGWIVADPNPDSSQFVGYDTSLTVVNGRPAISYRDATNNDLKYVRASNSEGSAWDTPQTLDSTVGVGYYTSLAMVNGHPAVSYYDAANKTLKYIRSSDTDGNAWGTPHIADDGTAGSHTSLAVINGNPAISYHDGTAGALKYVRATNAAGSAWGTPQTLDNSGSAGQHTSLAVVNGKPAISYYSNFGLTGELKFVRANDTDGSSWWLPQTLDTGGNVGEFTSLAVVNGRPAISYRDASVVALKYIRATSASGGFWEDEPLTIDGGGAGQDVGWYSSLKIVNGKPAIGYYDFSNGNLKYVRAVDSDGAAWYPAQSIDIEGVSGEDLSLAEVNGKPAMSYNDSINGVLKYISR